MTADPSFLAWVDETGDDGDKFGKGSSEFLALSALVAHECLAETYINSLFDHVSAKTNKPLPWNQKFTKCPDATKWLICSEIAERPFYAAHVLVHKPSIRDAKFRADRNRLYRYASKFLIERISWICQEHDRPNMPGDRTCRVIFSEDKSREYEEFRNYVRLLAKPGNRELSRTNWAYIDPDQIDAVPFRDDPGLMLADFNASALGAAIEQKRHGVSDDRFARILRRNVLSSTNGCLGLGYKIWPNEVVARLTSMRRFDWIKP